MAQKSVFQHNFTKTLKYPGFFICCFKFFGIINILYLDGYFHALLNPRCRQLTLIIAETMMDHQYAGLCRGLLPQPDTIFGNLEKKISKQEAFAMHRGLIVSRPHG